MTPPTVPAVAPAAALAGMRLFCAFALLALLPTVVWDVALQSGVVARPADDRAKLELMMGCHLVGALALGAFAAWQPPAALRPWRVGLVCAAYPPVLIAWSVLLFLYLAAMHRIGWSVPPQASLLYCTAFEPHRPGFWVVVLGAVIAAPVGEEIVFRGYLHALLRRFLSPSAAILVGGAVFGLLHGLHYALPIAVLGCWFGWLRERTGALLPSLLAHSLHNAVVLAVAALWPDSIDCLYPR